MNAQILRYTISIAPKKNSEIFKTLMWAGYLQDWDGPAIGERPVAYIILSIPDDDGNLACYDCGIAAQSILLGAVSDGYGGCMIGSFNSNVLKKAVKVPKGYKPQLVIALGKPSEIVFIDEISEGESIEYWRDKEDAHHVPKIRLADIIYKEYQ